MAPPIEQRDDTDDQLAQQIKSGNHDAFAQLVERYKRPVYSLAYRLLGNTADAEDAAQETFVRAFVHIASYRSGSRFGSWLLAITSHWCIDFLRRRRTLSLDAPSTLTQNVTLQSVSGELPEEWMLQTERRDEVQSMLAQLAVSYRTVLVLRYWHDLSYTEIAAATGLPVSTIRMRLFRARQLLAMGQQGSEDTASGLREFLPVPA